MFYSISFPILGVIFKYLIHLCKWYKIGVEFHSFACSYPVFSIPFIEETVFSYCMLLALLSNISWLYKHEFVSAS